MAFNKSFVFNYASLCLLLTAAFFEGSKYLPVVTSEEFPQVISYPSRHLCESCSSSYVCHSIVDAPASKGYCVDDCKHCLGSVCQICHPPNSDNPTCHRVESDCNKSKDCCGHSSHASTCWKGTCKVTKGHYCWKKSICADDLWCHKEKCIEPKHDRESDILPRPNCPEELQRILFRIRELRRRNFEIVNLIIRILRFHFPQTSSFNKVEDFSGILSRLGVSASDINKLDTSTYVSSGANDDAVNQFEDITGGCQSALKRAEEELKRLEEEHEILLRILQILLARFGPRDNTDYENLNTEFAGYTQNTAASSLPSTTNYRKNLRDEDFFMTTVDNEGNDVTHLLRKISSLQEELDIAGIPRIIMESESIEIGDTNHISEENMKDVENRYYDNKEHEDDVNKSELNLETPNDIKVLKERGNEVNEIENAQQDREERLINGNF